MARNKFGTQPTTAQPTANRRGRGGGPGNHPGRGRGPAGGRKIPNTGAYKGKAGEALANQDIDSYISDLLTAAGWKTGSGTPADMYANQVLATQLANEYGAARANRQKLSAKKYFQNRYGAGPQGKSGAISAGALQQGQAGEIDTDFGHFYSNTFADEFLRGEAGRLGLTDPTGSNAGFNDFALNYAVNTVKPQFEQARAAPGQGQMNLDDWLRTRDWMNQARHAFATRGNSQRQPGPLDLAGRYSWWA
jgi:hypothetical protein